MLIKRVVINSSPLIVLFKSEQADLLPQLFSEIIVPGGVWDEITAAECWYLCSKASHHWNTLHRQSQNTTRYAYGTLREHFQCQT